jgi:hypothetical protein
MPTADLEGRDVSVPELHDLGEGSLLRVLFVTNILPVRGSFGSQCVNYALLEFLANRGCSVHVCCLQRFDHRSRITLDPAEIGGWSTSYTGFYAVSPTEHRRFVKYRVLDLIRRFLTRVRRHLKIDIARLGTKSFVDWLTRMSCKAYCAPPDELDIGHFRRYLEIQRPDCVLVDYAWLTPLLEMREIQPNRPLRAVLTHDLIHKRVASLQSRSLALDVPPGTLRWRPSTSVWLMHFLSSAQTMSWNSKSWLPTRVF